MNKIKQEKGITLISLMVTAAILVILSFVTISSLFGDNGLIEQARKRADKETSTLEEQESEMNSTMQEYEGVMEEENEFKLPWYYDENGDVTNGIVTLQIGDYVDYDCTTSNARYTSSQVANGYGNQTFTASDYKYGWRVLGIDEETGELLILAEDFVPLTGGYTDKTSNRTYYYLKGQAGYANGVNELNNICEIYGQGEGATGARSITMEDIDKITGYNPNNVGVNDSDKSGKGTKYAEGSINEYGNRVSFYWDGTINPYYTATNGLTGKLTDNHSNGFSWYNPLSGWQTVALSTSATTAQKEQITTLESNFYSYYPNTLTSSASGPTVGINTNSTAYKMLFTNSSTGAYSSDSGSTNNFYYWLATMFLVTYPGSPSFGIDVGIAGFVSRIQFI